jgi:hypothetical protein
VVDLRGVDLDKVPKNLEHLQKGEAFEPETESDVDESGLLKFQWENFEYLRSHDPEVIAMVEALFTNIAQYYEAVMQVMNDQLKVEGWSPQQIKKYNDTLNAFVDNPQTKNLLADSIERCKKQGAADPESCGKQKILSLYENRWLQQDKADEDYAALYRAFKKSDKASAVYQGLGEQQGNDCTLYALANVLQIPEKQIDKEYRDMMKNLATRPLADREDPDKPIALEDTATGLYPYEYLYLAQQHGQAKSVKFEDTQKTIDETGSPVFFNITVGKGNHAVAVTSVFKKDGKEYVAVMDSNATNAKSFTYFVLKDQFESMLITNGLSVTPGKEKPAVKGGRRND